MPGKEKAQRKLKAVEIMREMRVKIEELDSLRKGLAKERYSSISPSQSRAMLEEIKVPSLEMIRDERKRHSAGA